MGKAINHTVLDRDKPSFVIFDIRALTLSPERQSARMSKITNDGCTHMATVGVKELNEIICLAAAELPAAFVEFFSLCCQLCRRRL